MSTMNMKLFDTPWKVRNEIERVMLIPIARLVFWLNGIKWISSWRIYGLPILQRHRQSEITIGKRMNLRSSRRSNPLSPNHPVVLSTRAKGARLTIGADFAMTGGTVCVDTCIDIGDRVTVGANSIIVDTDFHPLVAQSRTSTPNAGESIPTIIEDDVFIGANCIVLKGVRLGKGCVLGAGSIVVHSVPPFTIAGGVPAKVLKHFDERNLSGAQ